jgi:hypothetical protein
MFLPSKVNYEQARDALLLGFTATKPVSKMHVFNDTIPTVCIYCCGDVGERLCVPVSCTSGKVYPRTTGDRTRDDGTMADGKQ